MVLYRRFVLSLFDENRKCHVWKLKNCATVRVVTMRIRIRLLPLKKEFYFPLPWIFPSLHRQCNTGCP